MCSDQLTIKSGSSSHKSRSACLPAILGCLLLILACRLQICSEGVGDLPQVRSWFSPLSHLLSKMRFLFLHSSTIVSVADLAHPNLPVHNKLIFAKFSRPPRDNWVA